MFKVGQDVTWTEAAVERANSGGDMLDAALVCEDETLNVEGIDEDNRVYVRNRFGHVFPANPNALCHIGA